MAKGAGTARPLPNEFLHAGDLCPKSFAGFPENHTEPAEAEGWGVCKDCGETVNLRSWRAYKGGPYAIPQHRIPGGPQDDSERTSS